MSLYGPVWPLKKGNEDTYQRYSLLKDQVVFYMRNLLLTSPGEKISDPSYGVGIRAFLFEQTTLETQDEMIVAIESKMSTYMPYINIERIETVNASPYGLDSNSVAIKILYRFADYDLLEEAEIEINQNSSIGFF